MKKTISLLLLLSVTLSSYSQNNDSILFNQLMINTFSTVQTENSLTTLLGSPNSIESYENEIDKETWKDYKYSGNSFYFFNNNLVSFSLRNDAFYFFNSSIKVGNNISVVSNIFQNSFLNKEVLNNLGFIIIDINMPNGTISDTFVVINYNPINDIISSIHLGMM
jgi:hypothetical protein